MNIEKLILILSKRRQNECTLYKKNVILIFAKESAKQLFRNQYSDRDMKNQKETQKNMLKKSPKSMQKEMEKQ